MLKNISYSFTLGKIYILLGHSGSGKSTLLHLIANLLPITGGDITYNKRPIQQKDVALIMQQPYFYGDLSIIDNININYLFSKKIKRSLLFDYCKRLQISHILKQKASICSGGEKARANIVRGLLLAKPILLIDEPTAHLDAANGREVAKLLQELCHTKIIIITTHQRELFAFDNAVFLTIAEGRLYEN